MSTDFAAIILAAGKGSRMKSTFSKVLHEVGGKSLIERTVETLRGLDARQIIAVVGFDAQGVKKALGKQAQYANQKEQLGTADAAKVGLAKVKKGISTAVILNGDDSAFYKKQTIADIIKTHADEKSTLTFVTLEPENPTGLGRVVRKNGRVVKIVEENDATDKQKEIKEVNDGLYVIDRQWLEKALPQIERSTFTNEYYLVDLIKLAIDQNHKVTPYKLKDPSEWHGVNTLEDLRNAHIKLNGRIHIMGIAGAGAAAVAGIAKAAGYTVSGCDLNPQSAYSQNLDIKIEKGHSKEHIKNIDMLITSPAVEKLDPKNPEIKFAKEMGIPTMTWQQFQGKFLQIGKFTITVAGAFGKSTTTTMIAQILIDAGLDPTCEIGARVIAWGNNFKVGNSDYYVCESDEYNNNFLNYSPDVAVVLNVEWDHPDFFKNREAVLASYQKFIDNIKPGGILIIPDDPQVIELAKGARPDIKIEKIMDFGKIDLQIIGTFRKQNADAALTVAHLLQIDTQSAKKSLENFKGLGRRLEQKGEFANVKFYDDYAVQPYTILQTSNALKKKYQESRVVLVFEPHTFSRINTFYDQFIKSLQESKVDQILVTDVYAAREKGDNKKLAQTIAFDLGLKAVYTGSIEQTARYVKSNLDKFDVVCSMGAGDSYKLFDLVTKNG